MSKTKFMCNFANLVNAGFPYIYIPSYEEERITSAISGVLKDRELIKTERKLYIWTQTDGLVCDGTKKRDTANPINAIESVAESTDDAVYIFKDFHIYFGGDRNTRPDYAVIRKLRDIIPVLKTTRKTIVFVSPKLAIPCDMEKEISILDFLLPTEEEIESLLNDLISGLSPENINLTVNEKNCFAVRRWVLQCRKRKMRFVVQSSI